MICLQAYIEELEHDHDRDRRVMAEMQERHWEELCKLNLQYDNDICAYQARIEDLEATIDYQARMLDHTSDEFEWLEAETAAQSTELEELVRGKLNDNTKGYDC
jgi:hypothetical protein